MNERKPHQALVIGCPWPDPNRNPFAKATEGGSKTTKSYRRLIKIVAEDNPNVKLGLQKEGER